MTVHIEEPIPNPLDYVKYLVYNGKVELASIHAVDLLARSQETDDKELKAWHIFFSACIKSNSDPAEALRNFAALYNAAKVDETVDAQLLFYACISMAAILCGTDRDESVLSWPFHKVRNTPGSSTTIGSGASIMFPHHGVAGHVHDRISNLLRATPDPSALSLINQARRLLNIYSGNDVKSRLISSLSHVCQRLDLGKRFSPSPSVISSDCTFTQIDDVLDSNASPSSFLISALARVLSTAIKQRHPTTVWRSLLRLTRVRLQEGLVAQALVILDDIEEHILADCDVFEWGIFFQTRTDSLLRIASLSPGSDLKPLMIDAFHNLQLAIACFDRTSSIQRLTRSVLMASLLANKLKMNPFTNFYSVKAAQIRSSMDCSGARFFPIEGLEIDDIKNVMEYTGQPKLPSANLNNPQVTATIPTSPMGRGMQTLIAWRQ